MKRVGFEEGSVCNRNKCDGIMELVPVQNCSCHTNPPCSACERQESVCTKCEWQVYEDSWNEHKIPYNTKTKEWEGPGRLRDLDPTTIDWHDKSHTHFSMIKEGVYPEGTTQAEVLAKVKGTFGGRFTEFGKGKFKYIAYTD